MAGKFQSSLQWVLHLKSRIWWVWKKRWRRGIKPKPQIPNQGGWSCQLINGRKSCSSKCHLFTLANSLQHRAERLRGWLGIEKSRCGSHCLKTLFSKWLSLISWAVSTAMLCFPAAHGICTNRSWVSISPMCPGRSWGSGTPRDARGDLVGCNPMTNSPWFPPLEKRESSNCSMLTFPCPWAFLRIWERKN